MNIFLYFHFSCASCCNPPPGLTNFPYRRSQQQHSSTDLPAPAGDHHLLPCQRPRQVQLEGLERCRYRQFWYSRIYHRDRGVAHGDHKIIPAGCSWDRLYAGAPSTYECVIYNYDARKLFYTINVYVTCVYYKSIRKCTILQMYTRFSILEMYTKLFYTINVYEKFII